jgi:hypothetical protein
MIATQQTFNNAFIAGLLPRTFESSFISGLIPRDVKPETIPLSKDKVVAAASEPSRIKIKVGEPVFLGKKGEKQHKITLESFNENVLVLKTIDVSHGAGYIVLKKQYIATTRKEITVTINN